MIGTKLGHEITAHMGSVGMGEVFQTTDTKSWGAVLRSSFFLTLGIGYRITPLSHFELARGWKTVFDFPMLRLRTTDDPLFVRTNRGLTPTQRALGVPSFSMCQAWHEIHRADPAHRWLRETIGSTAAAVAA
jgi:hypothetical protein